MKTFMKNGEAVVLTDTEANAANVRLKSTTRRAIGRRVIVLLDEESEMTKGGVLMPDVSKKTKNEGTVMSIGELVPRDAGIRVGDHVAIAFALPRVDQESMPGKKLAYVSYPEEILCVDDEVWEVLATESELKETAAFIDSERAKPKLE